MTPLSRSCETLTALRLLFLSESVTADFSSGWDGLLQPATTIAPTRMAAELSRNVWRVFCKFHIFLSWFMPNAQLSYSKSDVSTS